MSALRLSALFVIGIANPMEKSSAGIYTTPFLIEGAAGRVTSLPFIFITVLSTEKESVSVIRVRVNLPSSNFDTPILR